MLKQEIKPPKMTSAQAIRLILLIIITMLLASVLVNFLVRATGMELWDALYILMAGVVVYRIMVTVMRNYRYTLTNGVLLLERLYGGSTRSVVRVEAGDMLYLSDAEGKPGDAARMLLMAPPNLPAVWLGYVEGGVRCAVRLAANEDLRTALEDVVEKNETMEMNDDFSSDPYTGEMP